MRENKKAALRWAMTAISAATLAAWPQALELARAFWHSAAGDERISPGFQAIARQNLIHLQAV